jgi:exopolyphosphatase/pppGpp-phosphohydrolase
LVERLRTFKGDFRRFSEDLRRELGSLKAFDPSGKLCPIILGSAGTKVAWIKVKQHPAERYDPGRVHGQLITSDALERLVAMAIKDPALVRRVIDPVNPQSAEFETVMTGIVAIEIFMKSLGKTAFKVSANGSRYGVLWMTAIYRKLGFVLPDQDSHQKG